MLAIGSRDLVRVVSRGKKCTWRMKVGWGAGSPHKARFRRISDREQAGTQDPAVCGVSRGFLNRRSAAESHRPRRHGAAVHAAPIDGAKRATGHFFALSLRIQALSHLTHAQGKKEHDMHALKRLDLATPPPPVAKSSMLTTELVVCMQLKSDHVFANPAEKRSSGPRSAARTGRASRIF